MPVLQGKKILFAVTGGIAAYKTPHLVRSFIKQGAQVQVLLTEDAEAFVSKLTLATVSNNPVYSTFQGDNGTWNNHVELALWADIILIAPLTANTLAKMAHGICDNLVLATYFSAKCPVYVAPAMDLDMYQHPTTKYNLEKIASFGNHIIPAASGFLASGLSGQGRMEEPENIEKIIKGFFQNSETLEWEDKKVLITAGPTYENIDPVRFIGNRSTGKMGFAIAQKAAEMGAKVTLVSGPVSLEIEHPNIELIRVQTADQMLTACQKVFKASDVAVFSAAVADYKPAHIADQKIKKSSEQMQIDLIKNPDILKTLAADKGETIVVGFALETENAIANAQSKLNNKNADLIVLNTLQDAGAGFGTDTNKVTFVTRENNISFDLKSKNEVAADILQFVAKTYF
ncbi:MAG: bifunctional phosphopantothenoylcysteine decarboxylase/phosphopantothenate--cysteine ligase CoaBC [Weeksellaceae bacterium]|nr:bifunctional phosphopantothenoylcysteine decarboxylase/phosphopantothenate--cysteine ligase CoaBC [Weeksellaceae bacterium]